MGDEDCQHYVLDGGPNDTFNLGLFTAKPDQKTIDFTVVVSEGPWQKLCEAKYVPEQPLGTFNTPHGGVGFTHLMDGRFGSMIYVSHEAKDQSWRISAVDENGGLHPAVNIRDEDAGHLVTCRAEFDLPPQQITAVQFAVRPYSKRVTVKNLSLDSSHPTKPQIEVGEIKQNN